MSAVTNRPAVAPLTTEERDQLRIASAFDKAKHTKSEAGTQVSYRELRKALKVAQKDGFTPSEKQVFSMMWASLYGECGFEATPAARLEYVRLAEAYGLTKFPVI